MMVIIEAKLLCIVGFFKIPKLKGKTKATCRWSLCFYCSANMLFTACWFFLERKNGGVN